jgi:MFS transporter, FHS family, Na+ dependent glucose transporter 1
VRRSLGYFLLLFCLGLDSAIVGPTLASLAAQTGSTVGAAGLIFLLGAGASLLGTLWGSRLFDRPGARWIMGSAQLCAAASLVLVPHLASLPAVIGLFVIKGAAGGLTNTGANTLLVWTHGGRSAPFLNALHFFFGLGAFISPFLLGLLLAAGGRYADAYHVVAGVDAAAGILILAALRPPRSPHAPSAVRDRDAQRRPVALVVLSAALYLFFYVGVELTFGGWVSTYALTLHLADAAGAAFLTSVFWLCFTVGRLVSIPLALRVPLRTTIPVAMAGCAAFLVLLVAVPGAESILWITAAGAGLFMAPLWPGGYTLAGQSLALTARLSGLILLGDSLGGMVLPGLTGLIMERAGAPSMARLVLASLAAAAVCYLGIVSAARRRAAPASR